MVTRKNGKPTSLDTRIMNFMKSNPGWVDSGVICKHVDLTSRCLGGIVKSWDCLEKRKFPDRRIQYRWVGEV